MYGGQITIEAAKDGRRRTTLPTVSRVFSLKNMQKTKNV
jgi:hypothetical protein